MEITEKNIKNLVKALYITKVALSIPYTLILDKNVKMYLAKIIKILRFSEMYYEYGYLKGRITKEKMHQKLEKCMLDILNLQTKFYKCVDFENACLMK